MKSMRLVVPALLAAFALAGCSTAEKSAGTTMTVNPNCPMSGKAVDASHTEMYNGEKVGFCCGNCQAKWDKMSDAEKKACYQAAMKTGK